MEQVQRFTLVDHHSPGNSGENETALDAPLHYQQISRQWVVVPQSNAWRPPTDVYELDDRLVIIVEIAGMRDSDFSVVLQDRRLAVSGVRDRHNREAIAHHQVEVRSGRFLTEVVIPFSVERSQISAKYSDGFLRVELPRARHQNIHIVDVDSEQDTEQK